MTVEDNYWQTRKYVHKNAIIHMRWYVYERKNIKNIYVDTHSNNMYRRYRRI